MKEEINIIILVDQNHKGDDANALATGEEVKNTFEKQGFTAKSYAERASNLEAAMDVSKYNIVIAGEKNTTLENLIEIMDEFRRVGISSVAIATQKQN